MKTKGSVYNAKYWLRRFEDEASKVEKFLESVDVFTPGFPFVREILEDFLRKRENQIAQKKEYIGVQQCKHRKSDKKSLQPYAFLTTK